MWTLFRETYDYSESWCHAISFHFSKEDADLEAAACNRFCELNAINEYYFVRKTGGNGDFE